VNPIAKIIQRVRDAFTAPPTRSIKEELEDAFGQGDPPPPSASQPSPTEHAATRNAGRET
jgi:hypothetical protein